ncbi:protein of unknown function [Reichenbachiella agariperforans]|uniref:Alginate lyase 2 domain-containing protein n=1 Tax=Reichenbachiella agariperforans TaxID=156994 RepID=A0A1M6RSF0_REIAG|nr:polysaccharide lyase family 7 protein [Reichenbachiella agariperforans]SHK35344.1 protein of unknown function [Reichenbachiella agariperforans]
MKQYLLLLGSWSLLALIWSGCKEDEQPEALLNDAKQIETFVLEELDPEVDGVITDNMIDLTVPFDTDVTALTPSITISDKATVSPESGTSQNFSSSVDYTVTAEDGTSHTYSVTVSKEAAPLSDSKEIISFTFEDLDPTVPGAVDNKYQEVHAWVPYQSSQSALTPTLVISEKASISPESGVTQDFSNPITYTVTAEDGSTQEYIVTVHQDEDGTGTPHSVLHMRGLWKLTLPLSKSGEYVTDNQPGDALEIKPDELLTYSESTYGFFETVQDDAGKDIGVKFATNCGGARTSSGTYYPRTELREYNRSGNNDWSNEGSTMHRMYLRQAITKAPTQKPQVVAGQIHNGDDQILIRYTGNSPGKYTRSTDDPCVGTITQEGDPDDYTGYLACFYENSKQVVALDLDYTLGEIFELEIIAQNNQVIVNYNGENKLIWDKTLKNCYFKAGCYSQSSAQNQCNGKSSPDEDPDQLAEVVIYDMELL